MRFLQWVVTMLAAALGFAIGMNQADPATYGTGIGTVRITIRADWPGGRFTVVVPQAGYRRTVEPFRVPIEWNARVLRLNERGRRLLNRQGKVALAQLALDSEEAVVRSAARSFLYGSAGAVIAAVLVSLVFGLIFGGVLGRIVVALLTLVPLLAVAAIAYLIAGRGVLP
jgi:hypothetical protein